MVVMGSQREPNHVQRAGNGPKIRTVNNDELDHQASVTKSSSKMRLDKEL